MDPTFNKSYIFTEDVKGSVTLKDNLAAFSKEDDGYIIFIQNSLHYFISPKGIYISEFFLRLNQIQQNNIIILQ